MSPSVSDVDLIALSAYHESVEPYAYAQDDQLVVRLRLATGAAKYVDVVHMDKFRIPETREVVRAEWFCDAGEKHQLYQAKLSRDSKRFKYFFRVQGHGGVRFLSRAGVKDTEPHPDDAFETPYLGERDQFDAPEWTKGAVYYQVFPERFARADKIGQKADGQAADVHVELAPWASTPTPFSVFGGNLQGIIDRLDHLTALGIGVLYMTPVFKAPSNHKYDTVDYFAIDPQFGDTDTLRRLVEACHERGIRVVLDAVFNHMGARHPIFLDLLEKGDESDYRDWIYAKSWPLSVQMRNYETFGYVANMPKWRTAHPDVEDYLCRVGEYWIQETGIDGWRLDVSDEVEHRFWQHFRDRIKALKPDALICGEIWQVATPWLRGNEFDAVMNYPLGRAILDWLAQGKTNARDFYDAIDRVRAAYPEPVLHSLWNLLDSHDTPRLLTECRGHVTRMKLASFLQFTLAGAPLVYYGDEVGMQGGGDPLCRGGMLWDEEQQDGDLLSHYRDLVALRQRYEALRVGDLRPVARGRNRQLYAFLRRTAAQMVLVIVYAGKRPGTFKLNDKRLPQGKWTVAHGPNTGITVRTGESLALFASCAMLLVWTGDA